MTITSRQNQRVKDAVRLRIRRGREKAGQIIVDGAREILRAVEAGVVAVEAFVCDELCTSDLSRQAVDALRKGPAELLPVTPEVYEKLAFGERSDGVVLVAETPRRTLSDLRLPPEPLVAIVEGVEKPGNLGAILRTADAAGLDAVIVADGGTDLFNPNTIRASLGTVFRPNVCTATAVEVRAWLADNPLQTFVADPAADSDYSKADFTGGVAIVLGSEAHGLSQAWRTASATPIRLPMRGMADSLNVSATAAVLFYEAIRQRG